MPALEEVSTATAISRVEEHVEAALSGRDDARILDAGCGPDSSRAGFPVPGAFERAYVLGIDVDADALGQNQLLSERLVGDLQTVDLPDMSFDLVVAWDVLEHLADPLAAVRNVSRAVVPGGLLVLGVPNLWSLKGLVTKFTPFWFHRLAYRRLFDVDDPAGPYRTYLRHAIAPVELRRSVEAIGFETKLACVYGADTSREMLRDHRWIGAAWRLATALPSLLSFGRLRLDFTEAAFVFQRRP